MLIFEKYRWYILGALALILIIGAALYSMYGIPKAIPDTTEFQSGNFSFTYDRAYEAKEYASGAVSVGDTYEGTFIPLVDVVRYKSDPDAATPASFDAFMKHQAQSLCGSDSGGVRVSCADPVATPYVTPAGLAGEQLSLSLVRKNLATGTTSTSAYGPVYVFDTTASSTPDEPLRYQAVFVYPNFSSFFLAGTTSPAFVEAIASTITIED